MFVDASALTAMLTDEADARELLARLQSSPRRVTSPLAIWETGLAVARRLGFDLAEARAAVEDFLVLADIALLPVPEQAYVDALAAHARYGKGRHPAALNVGDCFAYACARAENLPLLYKGDDFAQTDIAVA